ncbi:hypothetical protein LEP1GSC100_4279 [Leptospira interrogans serovar Bataviae str. UI 08561]|nr:hypothetical protein LEP1GSC100_4279 [Leptospira interrogans serovar Bataviae str. UI 08561]
MSLQLIEELKVSYFESASQETKNISVLLGKIDANLTRQTRDSLSFIQERNDEFANIVKAVYQSHAVVIAMTGMHSPLSRVVTNISQKKYTNIINRNKLDSQEIVSSNSFIKMLTYTEEQQKAFVKTISVLKEYVQQIQIIKFPVLEINFPDDDSILIEWIKGRARIGISLEKNISKSFWYFHDFRTTEFFSDEGSLDTLYNRLFILLNRLFLFK